MKNPFYKSFLLFFMLLLAQITNAQYAKIVDEDGYSNLRNTPSNKGKIIKTLKSNTIVFASNLGNDNQEWSSVVFQEVAANSKIKYIEGFVHNSRLRQISDYTAIPSLDADDKGTKFICCGIEVEIKMLPFDIKREKSNFVEHDGYRTYKGKFAFGTWGIFPPKIKYSSISGSIHHKEFEIPISDLENLFDIKNDNAFCNYDERTDTLYIVLNNSDGSDYYVAILIIEKGVYKGILVNQLT